MGKAYSEEEKEKIHQQLLEEGIKLFHENGKKTLSIRELTKRVGISQGGFYNFYESKEELIIEIANLRISQKLTKIMEEMDVSQMEPVEYFRKVLYDYTMDQAVKARHSQMYRDMLDLMSERNGMSNEKSRKGMIVLFQRLKQYGEERGQRIEIDENGLCNLVQSCYILLLNQFQLEEAYFSTILQALIQEGSARFIHISDDDS